MLYLIIPTKNNQIVNTKQMIIFNEVFKNESEIKIIVIDNSNNENKDVKSICDHNDWKYLFCDQDISVSDNFNLGLNEIKGCSGYSIFIGDDDFVTRDVIEFHRELYDRNVEIFRPIFSKSLYWKGFSSRRGVVKSDFEIRTDLISNFFLKKSNSQIDKYNGPQYNSGPSLYHCLFNNDLIDRFTFGPFAPDSYSFGYFNSRGATLEVGRMDSIIPGVAPKSSSAFTSSGNKSSFYEHPHTRAFLNDSSDKLLKELEYIPSYIWYLSYYCGQERLTSASSIPSHIIIKMKADFGAKKSQLRFKSKIVSILKLLFVRKSKLTNSELVRYLC